MEEYPEIQSNSIMPDFNQLMTKRLESLKQNTTSASPTSFDPHKMMVQKKQLETGEIDASQLPVQTWPEKDIKVLEDFCKKYGIVGVNFGKMHPLAALAMLKKNLGIVDSLGEGPSIYNQNCPYSSVISQRTLLKG